MKGQVVPSWVESVSCDHLTCRACSDALQRDMLELRWGCRREAAIAPLLAVLPDRFPIVQVAKRA